MLISSPEGLCNLALGHLGNYGSVNDITTPVTTPELICALWYDITRQNALKILMPNFALARKTVSELLTTIPFGYTNAFEYPVDCLKVLGLSDVDQRTNYPYSVEKHPTDDKLAIYTDDDWDDGMELRYIADVTDVNLMSPEFKMQMSWELAGNIALGITQDPAKKNMIEKLIPAKRSEVSGLNAQENRPIRVSNSLFKRSRYSDVSRNPTKR